MNKRNIITSVHNEHVKLLSKLHDRTKRNRYRLFLIEGYREVSRALSCGISVEGLFFDLSMFKSDSYFELLQTSYERNIECFEVSRMVFEKVSKRENGDGIIALANFWDTDISSMYDISPSFVLVAERIEKSGNLGALMRSAESAGVDMMILCNPVTDIFNPNVVRASQGALFNLKIAVTDNISAYDFLTKKNLSLFATTPSSKNYYFSQDFCCPLAILVGSEHNGLSDFWLKKDDVQTVMLPQMGISDSLNVNDAAVIVLYDVIRQRMVADTNGSLR